jgi:hypothetical protein
MPSIIIPRSRFQARAWIVCVHGGRENHPVSPRKDIGCHPSFVRRGVYGSFSTTTAFMIRSTSGLITA